MRRPEPGFAALAAAGVLCLAFLLSFALGIGRGGEPPPPDWTREPAPVGDTPRHPGQIEVLNASGRAGLARLVTDHLRDAGFDVVYFGNAPDAMPDSSVVLVRSGAGQTARAAAEALGIPRVRTQIDTTLYLAASIVIGSDWAPRVEPDTVPPSRLQRALDWVRPGRQ